MKRLLFSFAVMIFLISQASAQHGDILLYITGGTGSGTAITGGKLTTGLVDDGALIVPGTNPLLGANVFGYDFGEDPDPANFYLIGDPGFNNDAGPSVGITPNDGVLPGNSTLTITPVSVLFYWDGAGGVGFVPAPAGVQLGFKRGSTTGLVTGTGTLASFPTIGTTNPTTGRIHVHVESQLNFTDGTNVALPNAPDGIYYYGATLGLTTGGVASSDPIYFVYNNGLTETQHDAAIAAIQAIPEPGTWALLGCSLVGGLLAGKKLRRRFPAVV